MGCPTCGAVMVPMIFSSFCPNDCDRPGSPNLSPTPGSLIALDLGENIHHSDGRVFRAWILPAGEREWTHSDLPTAVDNEHFGRWIVPDGLNDENDIPSAIKFMRERAGLGHRPGWYLTGGELRGAHRNRYDTVVAVRTR